MYHNEILTVEDFVDTSKEWSNDEFLTKTLNLKNRLKECHNLRRKDLGYETYHLYNDEIGKLIEQLSTLLWRCCNNLYDKPKSETWEQYQINREIIRRFVPDFECPSWKNGPFSDWD